MIRRINAGNRIHFIPGIGIQVITPRAAAEKWWLAGGINPANCVFAFQPKGAASYSESLINLTGDSTYNLTEIVAPAWTTDNGWYRNGVNRELGISYVVPNYAHSWLVRFSNASVGYNFVLFRIEVSKYTGFYINTTYRLRVYNGINLLDQPPPMPTSGVLGVAGGNVYLDGVLIRTQSVSWQNGVGTIQFLALNGGEFYCKAVAFYNTILSEAQMVAVTAAMAAL